VSAETDLYSILVSDASVMSYVAVSGVSPEEGRIYPDVIPDRVTLPAISFQRVGGEYVQTIHDLPPSSELPTFEIVCVANTRAEADALGDAVQDAISGDFVLLSRSSEQDFEQNLWAAIIGASTSAAL
jgi:hypothetical protein